MASQHLEMWQKILWSEEMEQKIYRDWGIFFTHVCQLNIAIKYFNKALSMKEDDVDSLYNRSLCEKYMALSKKSLEDALTALNISELSQPICLQKCKAMFDSNDFEYCGVELFAEMRKFYGKKVEEFQQHFGIIEDCLLGSLGEGLHRFMLENRALFKKITEIQYLERNQDTRPRWKILREQEMCDVVSISESIEELVHPRERARRIRGYHLFNQQYLNRSWIDVPFMKSLKKDKVLCPPQLASSGKLKNMIDENYTAVINFLRMLEARDPLYKIKYDRCKDMSRCTKYFDASMKRIQYKTKRQLGIVLDQARQLKEQGQTEKLCKYLEAFMGDYLILKTHKIVPWKFEYINEIYNILGLTYIEEVITPVTLYSHSTNITKLFALLKVSVPEEHSMTNFVFGKRSTWVEPEAIDYKAIRYKLVKIL